MNWSSNWDKPKTFEGELAKLEPDPGNQITLSIPIEGSWPIEIVGTKVGDLCIHVKPDSAELWMITHIPTLTAFMKAVPVGLWSREQLIKWAEKVQENHKEDWKKLARLRHNNYNNPMAITGLIELVKNRIKRWCLSVPVGE